VKTFCVGFVGGHSRCVSKKHWPYGRWWRRRKESAVRQGKDGLPEQRGCETRGSKAWNSSEGGNYSWDRSEGGGEKGSVARALRTVKEKKWELSAFKWVDGTGLTLGEPLSHSAEKEAHPL